MASAVNLRDEGLTGLPRAAALSRQGSWLAGIGVALGTLVVMLATEPRLAIVWDEGYTVLRLARVRLWFAAMAAPPRFAAQWRPRSLARDLGDRDRPPDAAAIRTREGLLSRRAIGWFWPFAREEPHGHPPFYALAALLGDVLTPGRNELARARLGSMLVFSATAGAIFAFLARRYGTWSGACGAAAFVLQPQLFALGHYAHYDGLLSCLWAGSIMAFTLAVEPRWAGAPGPRWGWAFAFGVIAGCAAGTKLTGWFLPLPFVLWTGLRRSGAGLRTLVLGGVVACVTLYAVVPPWWPAPMEGIAAFFRSNLTRGQTRPIAVHFLGRTYLTPNESLPWYNTLVWTLFATPAGILALGLLGALWAARQWRDTFAALVVAHWLFLLTLRALPHTPGHDGVRQFLPAFACLALLAGLGAGWLVRWRPRAGKGLVLLAAVEGTLSVILSLPVPLSYFSPAVGGLPGAARLGMEPTYYWDALTARPLDWVNTHVSPGQKVSVLPMPASYVYLQRSGRLQCAVTRREPNTDWAWYLVQNRTGGLSALDRALIGRYGPQRVIASQWGVPLVWAFPRAEVQATHDILSSTAAGRLLGAPASGTQVRPAAEQDSGVSRP